MHTSYRIHALVIRHWVNAYMYLWNHLNNFARGSPKNYSCVLLSIWAKQFRAIFDPKAILWTTLVENHLMMFYTKYERCGHCDFREVFLTQWPTYATNWNRFNNFCSGPHTDYSLYVWWKINKRFGKRKCFSETVKGSCMSPDARQRLWKLLTMHALY